MSPTLDQLERFITDVYGLTVKAWLGDWGEEVSKSSAWQEEDMRVTTKHRDGRVTTEDHGKFAYGTFTDSKGDRYKLVECDKDFPREKELVKWMETYDYFDVQEYRLIDSSKSAKDFFLYKIIPPTVNGVPVWDL